MDHRSSFGDGPRSIKKRKHLDAATWRKDDAPGSRDLGRPQDTAAVTGRPFHPKRNLSWTPDRIERRPAATAFRPAVVTIANAPHSGRDNRNIELSRNIVKKAPGAKPGVLPAGSHRGQAAKRSASRLMTEVASDVSDL